ncbi:MAG: PHP domain-containing protein [Eubacteriales bacterium]
MKYKTELHAHSAPVSACGNAYPEEIVSEYLAHGYSTVVLTNHLSRFTYKNKRMGDLSGLPWQEKVDYYMSGYHDLKAAADGKLNILFGCELRSNIDENDYLIYGITEESLRSTPDIYDLPTPVLSERVRKEGFLFLQAHPFRDFMQVVNPTLLDGIEIFNGNPTQDSRNDIARSWAERFGLLGTSGSDYHTTREGAFAGGIITDEPITSNEQLLKVLRSGKFELIRDNDKPF